MHTEGHASLLPQPVFLPTIRFICFDAFVAPTARPAEWAGQMGSISWPGSSPSQRGTSSRSRTRANLPAARRRRQPRRGRLRPRLPRLPPLPVPARVVRAVGGRPRPCPRYARARLRVVVSVCVVWLVSFSIALCGVVFDNDETGGRPK